MQTLAQNGHSVSTEALEQADEEALQTALLASMQSAPRHTLRRPLPPIPTRSQIGGASVTRPLLPIPAEPRLDSPRSSAPSFAAMSPLQTRIANAQLAGRAFTPRKLEQANDAALAAALQDSLDLSRHDEAMSPLQVSVRDPQEAGHRGDADALQIADDEALAIAIAQSLNKDPGAQSEQLPASHAAPTSPPEHMPSEAPPRDVVAQIMSMHDLQTQQMAITSAQQKAQALTKGAEAMVQLTSHI